MRIMCVEPGPQFSVHDVHVGYKEAFKQLGCDVAPLNLNDRLAFYSEAGRIAEDTGEFVRMVDEVGAVRLAAKGIEAMCFEFWPDVLWITSCFFIPMDTLDIIRSRGIKIVINHLESPYEDDRQARRAEHADLNIINDPTNIDRFPSNTVYLPAAHRPFLHKPGVAVPDFASEFVYVGTGFQSRIDFLERVDFDGIDVALAGQWQLLDEASPLRKYLAHDIEECLDNYQTADFYRSSLTGANLYRKESERPELAEGWACGPREIELAACGLWFARQSRPESDVLFPMLPIFNTPDELGEQIRWALAHPQQRQAAADAARNAVAERTFVANAATALTLLERQ